jgi:hypothetical protein
MAPKRRNGAFLEIPLVNVPNAAIVAAVNDGT